MCKEVASCVIITKVNPKFECQLPKKCALLLTDTTQHISTWGNTCPQERGFNSTGKSGTTGK